MELLLMRKHSLVNNLRQALGSGVRNGGGLLAIGADVGKGGSDQLGRHPKGSLVANDWHARRGGRLPPATTTRPRKLCHTRHWRPGRCLWRTAAVPGIVRSYSRATPVIATEPFAMPDPAPHPSQDADRNLLYGVLCLQADLITAAQFAEACSLWAGRKNQPLDQLLVERGWLTAADKALIDMLIARKLHKHGGDAHQSLAAVAGVDLHDLLKAADDPDVRQSLATLAHAPAYVLLSTVDVPAERRERFTLTRLHAEGGLGRVYVAHDHDLNRDVALKEIRPERAQHPDAWQRFLKEAQLTGQLEHPNIVPIYEVGKRKEGEPPFYTMRLVRGQTLRNAVADYHTRRREGREDPLERPRLLNAFVSVCLAVGYAHSRGVIHRDLKPENVMLGGFGEVIVLDWGLAKMIGRPDESSEMPEVALTDSAQTGATMAGRVLGTPAYLAPEQAEGRTDLVDPRTDIYGLGTILFEILTGRAPHKGSTTEEIIRRITGSETPRARSADPTVAVALDAVCAKAMAKIRAERYATAGDLAKDVQRYLVDDPSRPIASRWPCARAAGRDDTVRSLPVPARCWSRACSSSPCWAFYSKAHASARTGRGRKPRPISRPPRSSAGAPTATSSRRAGLCTPRRSPSMKKPWKSAKNWPATTRKSWTTRPTWPTPTPTWATPCAR